MRRLPQHGPSMAIVMIMVMTMVYAGMIVAVDYAARHELMRRDLRSGLDNFTSATRAYFRSYEAAVTAISETDCIRSRDPRNCVDLFQRLNDRFPGVVNFAATDRNGQFFASGQPLPASGPLDASGRPFFSELAGGLGMYVMDPHRGPLTGEPVVGFTVPLRDAQGAFDGVIGISTRFAELRTLWDGVRPPNDDVSVLLLDRNRKIIFSSHDLDFVDGLPEAEMARVVAELNRPEGSVSIREDFLFMAEDLFEGTWRVVTFHPGPYGLRQYLKDGGLLPYLILPVLLLGAIGLVLARRDWRNMRGLEEKVSLRTAELAATNQELSASVRTLGKRNAELNMFATVSSHDLREPLRAVSTYVSLIERRYGGQLDEDGRAFIQFARDGAMRANRVVLDLLDYTQAGNCGGKPAMILPGEAATQALARLDDLVRETGAVVRIDPTMPPLFLYEDDLAQLFWHLLDNALKHRHPERPPVVSIHAQWRDGEWVFCVEDNGQGIEAEYFEKIFVLFQRLDPRNAPEGTGIGLSICSKIVDKYGGRIWIESEPASGSRFLFNLPDAWPYAVALDTLPEA
ncbi:MAG: ATP-binding protein [Phaeospirillum sp.]|nr:ATP-binding protein [Phaeospirillum sp.]